MTLVHHIRDYEAGPPEPEPPASMAAEALVYAFELAVWLLTVYSGRRGGTLSHNGCARFMSENAPGFWSAYTRSVVNGNGKGGK